MLKWIAALSIGLAVAGSSFAAEAAVLTGPDAFGDWTKDAPGVTRHITIGDLPPPYATPSAQNFSGAAKRPDGATPKVPAGLAITLIASGIKNPRAMRFAPNGDLFVADSEAGEVLVYHFANGDTRPSGHDVFASGLHQPYGVNFYPPGPDPQWIYVADSNAVLRYPYRSGDTAAEGAPQTIVPNVPSNHHWTRDIVFSPDGKTMYLSVGSGSNIAEDMTKAPDGGVAAWASSLPLGEPWGSEEARAAVWSFTPDGRDKQIVATGLRNCAGMTLQPETGEVWCVVNERDELGDNLPFEYATHITPGAWYGWPWYYLGNHEDPRHAGERPDLAGKATLPDVLMQAHSAPLNIVFDESTAFGPDYKGDAFVALHGSWNRGTRTGYKVVRLKFENGKPTGTYEDFVTGFVLPSGQAWGRPVGVAIAPDGSLFISEDGNGTIWRVSKD